MAFQGHGPRNSPNRHHVYHDNLRIMRGGIWIGIAFRPCKAHRGVNGTGVVDQQVIAFPDGPQELESEGVGHTVPDSLLVADRILEGVFPGLGLQ
jgi:hypothetical protein